MGKNKAAQHLLKDYPQTFYILYDNLDLPTSFRNLIDI